MANWNVEAFKKQQGVAVDRVYNTIRTPYDMYTLEEAEELASKLEQAIRELRNDTVDS